MLLVDRRYRRIYEAGRARCIVLVLGLLTLRLGAEAQAQEARWTAHTSMREVAALAVSGEDVWVATAGGIFAYTPATGAFRRYTPAEGLHDVQTQALAYDERRGCVWVGYQDGVIDRLDVETGEVRTFRDIERTERFGARAINRFLVQGDSLLVATSFGLVVFDPVKEEVRDTYSQLGSLPPATPVRDVVVAPVPEGTTSFWLATDAGIAQAPRSTINLQDPSVWHIEQTLSTEEVRAIAFFQGRIYAGTSVSLTVREADGTYQLVRDSEGDLADLYATDDVLLATRRFNLLAVYASGAAQPLAASGFQDPGAVVVGPDGHLYWGDRQRGLVSAEMPATAGAELSVVLAGVFPEGPYDHLFAQFDFDGQGNLWAASALSAASGFFELDTEGRWTSYTGRFFEALQGRSSFTSIYVAADGSAWAGSEGQGLARVTPEDEVRTYQEDNSSLLPVAGFPGFILVGGVGGEPDGTLWVTTMGSSRPLHVRQPDGTWTALAPKIGGGLTGAMNAYGEVFVDAFRQKWIIVRDERSFNQTRGLMVLDTGASPTDASDDRFQYFDERGSAGQGLPGTVVTAVTEDRDGLIWIGTENGLAYLINTGIVAADPNATPIWPQWAQRSGSPFVLFGLRVNDIAVDPANRLWVATNDGAWLIGETEGGYEEVAHFTAGNSPLFSDVVLAVAVDEQTGTVFFATDRGLISYRGDATAPAEQSQALLVYPNPVRMRDGAEPRICIEGLVEETEVRIVAPHGSLVARFAARGGQSCWDGRDINRQFVPSGVYLVVAVGQNGEGAAYGKVAVIR